MNGVSIPVSAMLCVCTAREYVQLSAVVMSVESQIIMLLFVYVICQTLFLSEDTSDLLCYFKGYRKSFGFISKCEDYLV